MSDTAAVAIPTGVWTDDKAHTSVRYAVEHNSASTFRGGFGDVDIKVEFTDEGPVVTGTAKVESLDIGNEQLLRHVLSPDFFDAERYPEITYKSTAITYVDDEVAIEGDLTIKGEAKPLTIRGEIGQPFQNMGGGHSIAVKLHAEFDRTQYGIAWHAELPNGDAVLGNDVSVEAEFELVQS